MSLDNKFVRSLIQSARQGNNAAIEQLFKLNLGKIYALALRLTADKSQAMTITKDTFIEAWKKINLVRPDASFVKWLSAITVFKTIDCLRLKRNDPNSKKSDFRDIQSKDEFENHIFSLPEQERMIFVLNKVEGYTVDEIADLMGMKKDPVNAHLKLALDKLSENDPELKSTNVIKERVSKLFLEIQPPQEVSNGIASFMMEEKIKEQKEIEKNAPKIEEKPKEEEEEFEEIKKPEPVTPRKRTPINIGLLKKIGAAVLGLAIIFIIIKLFSSSSSEWEIIQFTGQAKINNENLTKDDTFTANSTIETGPASSVAVSIPNVGRLLIDASTTITRLEKEYTLRIESGQIKKIEGNAAEILTLETPLASIKDLYKGAAYKLNVIERGISNISVESGWLIVKVKEFDSYVPKNFNCVVSVGHYAIPYQASSSGQLTNLLENFSGVNDPSIGTILSLITEKDALSLWHIIQLVSSENRFIVFDRLNEFVQVPSGVTKEGIQALNKDMLLQWRQEIELKMD